MMHHSMAVCSGRLHWLGFIHLREVVIEHLSISLFCSGLPWWFVSRVVDGWSVREIQDLQQSSEKCLLYTADKIFDVSFCPFVRHQACIMAVTLAFVPWGEVTASMVYSECACLAAVDHCRHNKIGTVTILL